jgi:hypothetical protein
MSNIFKDRKDVQIKNFGKTGVDYTYLDESGAQQKGKVLYTDMVNYEN